MKTIKQVIFGKKYKLLVAISKRDKKKGMNIFLKQPNKTGMLFPYNNEIQNRSFTLSKTPFDLMVIFLDRNKNIIYREVGKRYQKKHIVCPHKSMFVIEIPV